MCVEIFITTKFTGKVTHGNGAYGIAIRTEKRPETMSSYVMGWRGLSYQKLNVRAVVDAIQSINHPSQVKMFLDNVYAIHMIEKGMIDAKYSYAGLWKTFQDVSADMEKLIVVRQKNHEYRRMLLQKINAGGYPVINDR